MADAHHGGRRGRQVRRLGGAHGPGHAAGGADGRARPRAPAPGHDRLGGGRGQGPRADRRGRPGGRPRRGRRRDRLGHPARALPRAPGAGVLGGDGLARARPARRADGPALRELGPGHGVRHPPAGRRRRLRLRHRRAARRHRARRRARGAAAQVRRLARPDPGPAAGGRSRPHHPQRRLSHRRAAARLPPGRVALVGDAAHAMTPNLGQGACQAIEDGVVLAHHAGQASRGPGGALPDGALAAYSAARVKRTAKIVQRSWSLCRMSKLRNPLAVGLRDFGLSAAARLSPDLMLRSMDEVLSWRPPAGAGR
ncbi:FAD-dependent monooxygenase [Nonomuraea thailandensis]